MAINHLIKGEADWHNKINANFDAVADEARQIAEDVAANDKVPLPVSQTLDEGYVYLNQDGKTKLIHPGDVTSRFKYSFIMDNGYDGTPSAIEYADDCTGFIPMTMSSEGVLNEGDWANNILVNMFKPCVIAPEDEVPKYYLRKNEMTKKLDGTDAILTGEDGDVMVQVDGVLYGRITTVGAKIKVSIMNYKEHEDCFCFNEIDGDISPKMYRGRYKAGVVIGETSIMRSISNVIPLVSITSPVGRTRAKARGEAYHQNNVFMLFLWQAMYLLLFKNRNSQAVLGKGRTELPYEEGVSKAEACGWSNDKPWIWGNQTGTDGVVFLGVEDFYGNVHEWVDGVVLNTLVYKLTRDTAKYNDTGVDYEISAPSGLSNAVDHGKYLKSIQGTNDLGFLPASTGASSSTFFCDYVGVNDAVQVVRFGGTWGTGATAGAFYWALTYSASTADWSIGSRLCRK